jgi:LacI family transcriptional regulator
VASILSSVNYELVIYPVNSVEHLQGHLSSIPIRRNLDGLIIMSLALEVKDAQRLRENGIETVLIEFFHEDLNSIVIDDMDGGKLAADHLIGKGHRRIAFFGDIEPPERLEIHPVLLRLQGFRKVIREAGLKLPGRYVVQAGYASQNSQRSARALLGAAEPPTAVFAASDIQAIIVIKEANRRGMRIPDDLAVIGFDDIDLAEYMDLTTIRQELDESGKLATEILLSKRLDPDRPPQHLELPLTLIARRTT